MANIKEMDSTQLEVLKKDIPPDGKLITSCPLGDYKVDIMKTCPKCKYFKGHMAVKGMEKKSIRRSVLVMCLYPRLLGPSLIITKDKAHDCSITDEDSQEDRI